MDRDKCFFHNGIEYIVGKCNFKYKNSTILLKSVNKHDSNIKYNEIFFKKSRFMSFKYSIFWKQTVKEQR